MPNIVVARSSAMPYQPLQLPRVWIPNVTLMPSRIRPVLSPVCTYINGHGVAKGLIREVHRRLPKYPFFASFDMTAFHDSIVHAVLIDQLKQVGISRYLQEHVC